MQIGGSYAEEHRIFNGAGRENFRTHSLEFLLHSGLQSVRSLVRPTPKIIEISIAQNCRTLSAEAARIMLQ